MGDDRLMRNQDNLGGGKNKRWCVGVCVCVGVFVFIGDAC